MAPPKTRLQERNSSPPSTPPPSKKTSKGSNKPLSKPTQTAPSTTKASAKKKANVQLTSKKQAIPPKAIEKFSSVEAKENYELIKKKKLLPEKGFLPSSVELPQYITEVIEKHNWETFCLKPMRAIVPLVREFYANLVPLLAGNGSEVVVRGKKFVVNAAVINSLFGLENFDVADFNEMIQSPCPANYDEALRFVANDEAQWEISKSGVRTLRSQKLTPAASVWLYFIKNRLLPTTHDTTISEERILLLYSILAGLSINVGKIISWEISSCARKKSGKLFFPSLITHLCIEAGVPYESDEELLFERLDIDFFHLAQKHGATSQDGPSSSAPLSTPDAYSLSHIYARQAQIIGRLEHLEKQQHAYWSYAEKRDIALRKSLQKNFTKPTAQFPSFPQMVLEPWTSPTSADEVPTHSNRSEE